MFGINLYLLLLLVSYFLLLIVIVYLEVDGKVV